MHGSNVLAMMVCMRAVAKCGCDVLPNYHAKDVARISGLAFPNDDGDLTRAIRQYLNDGRGRLTIVDKDVIRLR